MTDYRNSHTAPGYGEEYEDAYAASTFYGQLWETIEKPLVAKTLGELAMSGAKTCIDFACGTGRILSVTNEIFAEALGVDISASMLSQASKNVPRAELIEADITRQPLGRKFDVGTAFRFFRNAQPELRVQALEALADHIRPGGHLVVNTHGNPIAPAIAALKLKASVAGGIANSLSESDLSNLLQSSGFVVETSTPYSLLPRFPNFFPSWYSGMMDPVEQLVKLPLLRNLAESSLIVARRV